MFLALQVQTFPTDRGYGTVSSQYLTGNSSAEIFKRVNYKKFANRVLGICGICDIPSDDERTPIPPQEVQLETPVNSPLYNLWKDIPEGNKVPTGGFKHWKLDTTKAAQCGATDVYGCTIVIMLDGNDLLIGHYPQVSAGGTITMNDKAALGKIAVNWVPRDDGGATLELYLMNENPRRYAYDANGNNCGTVPS
ncbi:uncharacterized protein N7459_002777 [Penicillium hispanicum]|uniref:uncharacterized protein n=1 Tax=Penicillium hispanicum TaxID=1080232 RepID=UPI0025405B9D|nr:uncharacterized protein N7459_002777 [Penicillium hispanicum]KAJ5587012.1 hypothetical protein N7459_002777 [Penicillium hispanicum]